MAPSAISTNGVQSNGVSPVAQKKLNGVTVAELDASKLIYERAAKPRTVPTVADSVSGDETISSEHMVTAEWTSSAGWSAPVLRPYGPISLMPTASVLHYATECFEGLKAYRGFDGRLRLFRPDRNAERFLMSSRRISLPGFPPAELVKLMEALLAVDGPKWLPRDRPGHFMYLRPTMIGTQSQLGVQTPSAAMLLIIVTYMQRLDNQPGGMRLLTNPDDMIRAWSGGFGYAKLGANYGPSLLATNEARTRGFSQILWIYGKEGYCTEAGASNFMIIWRNKEGRLELVTAPLDDRIILDGVTRRSALQIVRERLAGELEVVERKFTIQEVIDAHTEGRLVECFSTGTAYFVAPVSFIQHRDTSIPIPMGAGEGGEYTLKIKGWLSDIIYGKEEHPWGVVIEEES